MTPPFLFYSFLSNIMGKFQVSDSKSEYALPSGEEKEAYSYGNDTLREIESSRRSINNNEVVSNDSSSSSEESSFY